MSYTLPETGIPGGIHKTNIVPSLAKFANVPPTSLPPHLQRSSTLMRQNVNNNVTRMKREAAPIKTRKSILSFPSDRNGCGFYRTIIPFNYLISSHEYDCSELFSFIFDLNYIIRSTTLRFQRQVTDAQVHVMKEYKKVISKSNSPCQLVYEIDDLVHEIESSNIVAYQFYTDCRKKNMLEAMNLCDKITVTTEFLKDFYEDKHGIKNIHVIPNYLPKFLWADKGKRDKRNKGNKPRVLWAGSASHVGKGGDLEFLIPLIKKTKKEFEWVFFGVIPPELKDNSDYEFHNWSDFWSYPQALDAINADIALCPIKDNIFNLAKSDLKVLEYTALGLPCVSSSIGSGLGPYDLIDGICTVENKVDDWYNAIKNLLENETDRENHMKAARVELNSRWLEDKNNIQKYLDVY